MGNEPDHADEAVYLRGNTRLNYTNNTNSTGFHNENRCCFYSMITSGSFANNQKRANSIKIKYKQVKAAFPRFMSLDKNAHIEYNSIKLTHNNLTPEDDTQADSLLNHDYRT